MKRSDICRATRKYVHQFMEQFKEELPASCASNACYFLHSTLEKVLQELSPNGGYRMVIGKLSVFMAPDDDGQGSYYYTLDPDHNGMGHQEFHYWIESSNTLIDISAGDYIPNANKVGIKVKRKPIPEFLWIQGDKRYQDAEKQYGIIFKEKAVPRHMNQELVDASNHLSSMLGREIVKELKSL